MSLSGQKNKSIINNKNQIKESGYSEIQGQSINKSKGSLIRNYKSPSPNPSEAK